jgi:hypothetical protein
MNIPSLLSLRTTIITASVALLIGLGAGGKIGWEVRDAGYQKHLLQDAKAAKKWAKEMAELSRLTSKAAEAVRTDLETRKQEVRETTRTITERIPYYVTAKSDAACPVPVGLVELHNQAATGQPASVPTSSSVDRDAPSRVALSELTRVIVHNYGVSQELEAEVVAWRTWYQLQARAWNAIADPSLNESDTRSGDIPFTPITIYDKGDSPGPWDGTPIETP